ncbi:MAG TPA: 4-alpha-glucanotransferase, partial [Actinomycetota bacterium]
MDEPRDLADALRERERELWGRVLDLTLVAWDGVLEDLRLRLPASELAGPYQGVAELEDGTERAWHPARVTVGRRAEVDGTEYVELVLRIGLRLPAGYHRLHARVAGRTGSSLLMAAPRTAPGLPDRRWGLFLPMHAVRTDRDWGLGDLSGLAELAGWTGSMGGRV